MPQKYRIRFFFDWQCTPFWSGNDRASERFGYAIDLEDLPLSEATRQQAYELSRWCDKSLNPDYPPDPGPWGQEECDRFNLAAKQLFEAVQTELGAEFELVNEQAELSEES